MGRAEEEELTYFWRILTSCACADFCQLATATSRHQDSKIGDYLAASKIEEYLVFARRHQSANRKIARSETIQQPLAEKIGHYSVFASTKQWPRAIASNTTVLSKVIHYSMHFEIFFPVNHGTHEAPYSPEMHSYYVFCMSSTTTSACRPCPLLLYSFVIGEHDFFKWVLRSWSCRISICCWRWMHCVGTLSTSPWSIALPQSVTDMSPAPP